MCSTMNDSAIWKTDLPNVAWLFQCQNLWQRYSGTGRQQLWTTSKSTMRYILFNSQKDERPQLSTEVTKWKWLIKETLIATFDPGLLHAHMVTKCERNQHIIRTDMPKLRSPYVYRLSQNTGHWARAIKNHSELLAKKCLLSCHQADHPCYELTRKITAPRKIVTDLRNHLLCLWPSVT